MFLKNKENRDKNDVIHTSCSKGFQQRSAGEKEKTSHNPSRIELFDITHVQGNGQAVNEPTQDALVFGPERQGRVRCYGARVTPTKLWGSYSSRMHDLKKRLHESEHKHLESKHKCLEADAELKEEVKHLKSMLEQQAIQMAELRRRFEEQEAS
ncbi:hypothetical protein CFP56_027331 [Quercus suber]|uniref:Uncharacterized protein n=1 Tax=Quercus suber TaxID=58331 RepID=A0AAW0LWZ8_QUESU